MVDGSSPSRIIRKAPFLRGFLFEGQAKKALKAGVGLCAGAYAHRMYTTPQNPHAKPSRKTLRKTLRKPPRFGRVLVGPEPHFVGLGKTKDEAPKRATLVPGGGIWGAPLFAGVRESRSMSP